VPTATPTPTPVPAAKSSYVSVWYPYIHVGDALPVQIQAASHSQHGIWTVMQFATGKQISYYMETDSKGF
jgi:hypothetical protein